MPDMNATPDPVASAAPAAPALLSRPWLVWAMGGVAVLALLLSALLWQRLGRMQEQLARQSQDAGQQSLDQSRASGEQKLDHAERAAKVKERAKPKTKGK